MKRTIFLLLVFVLVAGSHEAAAQFRKLETEHLRLIYFDLTSDFLSKHVARSFHNSLGVYEEMFDYTPSERVTLYLHDLNDHGNAGADVLPWNRITMAMAPLSYAFETAPANERINSTLHHELVHVLANDKSAGRDRLFRSLFSGKVVVSDEDPLSIFYSYLTAPRRYAPRWYQEGIAVFMETWMSAGLGRSLGGYDEMIFRTRVLENARLYDIVGLEAEGTSADFQVGVNSYLYGTRFMSYLAVVYGPERVVEWIDRPSDSRAHFTSRFKQVFGLSMGNAWSDWHTYERDFQNSNLTKVRENPVSPYREIGDNPLGSMSRAFYDAENDAFVAAVNYPGRLSHIVSVDRKTGEESTLSGIRGPTLFYVTSVAYDPDGRRLFYTTDNSRWRSLNVLDLNDGSTREILEEARVGDLAYNRADKSLWGVRHSLGFSTVVRIPEPYDAWETVQVLPFGQDIYDLDISPDGQWLSGAKVEIDGSQKLVRAMTSELLAGSTNYTELFDFGVSNPEGFVASDDGKYLYGASYLSGVSNIFRYDIANERMEGVSNAETGFFRPVPVEGDSLLAFRFTTDGFHPVMIPETVHQVSAIDFMGQRVVEEHPIVINWTAPPPSSVDLDVVGFTDEPYRPASEIRTESLYPIVHGYKDEVAIGLKWNLSDPLGMHHLSAMVTAIPSSNLPDDERFHASVDYAYLNWTAAASMNGSDFYDLFGPTKSSRKGYAVEVSNRKTFSWDGPRRNVTLQSSLSAYFDLERLPDFQNVAASFSELVAARASLTSKNLRSSLGAVDDESGTIFGVVASTNYVNSTFYPRIEAAADFGFLLPIPHVSLWLRSKAGFSAGQVSNPFANFYFGGFRNNWVDRRAEKQFRESAAFPGLEIDQLGGTNFGKVTAELILPPVRFRQVGGGMMFLKWLRFTTFSSFLASNIDNSDLRTRAVNAGVQADLRIMLFSYLQMTLSVGHARAREVDGDTHRETMFSVKIL